MSSIKYYISEAFKGIIRNGLMSFISVSTVAFCLFLFGFACVLSLNISNASKQLKTEFVISAYLDDNASIDYVEGKIKQMDSILSYTFESREQAFEKFMSDKNMSSEAFEGLDENPLRNSFNVTLRNLSDNAAVASELSQIQGVVNVVNRQDILNGINTISNIASVASVAGILVFAFISIFIIYNTIKLAVNGRRKEIAIMKYVGATDWFIRWPFIIEGIITGIMGAFIAYIPISLTYSYLMHFWNNTLNFFSLVPFSEINLIIIISFAILGLLLGSVGSILSVRKYLDV